MDEFIITFSDIVNLNHSHCSTQLFLASLQSRPLFLSPNCPPSTSMVQSGLVRLLIIIFLPQPPKYWYYSRMSPFPIYNICFLQSWFPRRKHADCFCKSGLLCLAPPILLQTWFPFSWLNILVCVYTHLMYIYMYTHTQTQITFYFAIHQLIDI